MGKKGPSQAAIHDERNFIIYRSLVLLIYWS